MFRQVLENSADQINNLLQELGYIAPTNEKRVQVETIDADEEDGKNEDEREKLLYQESALYNRVCMIQNKLFQLHAPYSNEYRLAQPDPVIELISEQWAQGKSDEEMKAAKEDCECMLEDYTIDYSNDVLEYHGTWLTFPGPTLPYYGRTHVKILDFGHPYMSKPTLSEIKSELEKEDVESFEVSGRYSDQNGFAFDSFTIQHRNR